MTQQQRINSNLRQECNIINDELASFSIECMRAKLGLDQNPIGGDQTASESGFSDHDLQEQMQIDRAKNECVLVAQVVSRGQDKLFKDLNVMTKAKYT